MHKIEMNFIVNQSMKTVSVYIIATLC